MQSAWNEVVRTLDVAPALWIGPVRPLEAALASQPGRLLAMDLSLCRRGPDPVYADSEDRRPGDDEWDWDCMWHRVEPPEDWLADETTYFAEHCEQCGTSYLNVMGQWSGRHPNIRGAQVLPRSRVHSAARCLVILSVRNFDQTLEQPAQANVKPGPSQHTAALQFAGSAWQVSVGLDTFSEVRFGCSLRRIAATPDLLEDPSADFSIHPNLCHIIRYRAKFIANGEPIDAGAIDRHGSQRRCFDGSLAYGTVEYGAGGYECEQLPVEIARFAISRSGCRHLRVELELEHIAYGLQCV